MPGGDRTGPLGEGAMTGRGAGLCSGAEAPGYRNFGFRRGGGFGFGGGRRGGWGFARFGRPFRSVLSQGDETALLKAEAEDLRNRLDAISKRLGDIEE